MSEQTSERIDNMRVYESFRAVPKEAQKRFSNGRFSGTDINPMWRIKRMTEMFGMCGVGWYVEVVNRELREAHDDNGTVAAFCALNLYINVNGEWSKPIYGEGGNIYVTTTSKGYKQVDDDAFKKAYTDAFSNATKQLGLGADVWFENDKTNGSKYVSPTNVVPAQPATDPRETRDNTPIRPSDILDMLRAAETVAALSVIWKANTALIERDTNLRDAFTRRRVEIEQNNSNA